MINGKQLASNDNWAQARAQLNNIIGDFNKGLTFTPEPKRDVYFWMQKYIRECQHDNRANVLKDYLGNIVKCATGQDYANPNVDIITYTRADVEAENVFLSDYITQLQCCINLDEINELQAKAEEHVRELDANPGRFHIDTVMREWLYKFTETAAETALDTLGEQTSAMRFE
jgi:hypothetical protein